MRLRRVATVAAVVLAAVVVVAGSIVRIEPGQLGASGRGWLSPGLHLRAPFGQVVRVPESGSLRIAPVETRTPAGASLRLEVTLRYRLSPQASRAIARDAARSGLEPALAPVLSEAVTRALPSRGASRPARRGSAADAIGAAFVARLRDVGISAEDLAWRDLDASQAPPVLPSRNRPPRKLLIVGLDGADWQIADTLLRAGRLPNLAGLIREGTRAPLRSYAPMISPLIWTTMVTGVGPDVHGVADFLVTEEATGRPIPITSRFRRVKALWNIFTDARISSGFAGWWASYPAERVEGVLVTDLLGFSMNRPGGAKAAAAITHPESYYAEIRPRLVLPDRVGFEEVSRFLAVSPREFATAVDVTPPDTPTPGAPPVAQDPVWHVRKIVAMSRNYETIALDLLAKDLDVVGVYFEGIDMMGHRFQHCIPPRMQICPDDEYARERDAVASFYVYQDESLGRLLRAAPGRTVMIVSDHGFRSGSDRPTGTLPYTTGQPVEWHREHGVFVLSGPGARRSGELGAASVFDVAPTVLYLQGLPAGEDMPGRVLAEAIDARDLAADPPRRIPTYEETGAPRAAPELAASPEAQQEMVEALQALGYVGPITTAPGGGASPGAAPATTSASGGPRSVADQGDRGTAAVTSQGSPSPAERRGETTRVTHHRNLATYYMKAGRFEDAEKELLAANAIQPLPKSFELLSEIRATSGDVDGAIRHLEEGLDRFPEMDQEAILWMIELRLASGGTAGADRAEEVLSRWRARLSRPALLRASEGKIALARGEDERALSLMLEALRLEPSLSQAAVTAAPLLEARGRLEELEGPITRSLAAEQRLDEYQNLLGLIRLRQGRSRDALEAIGLALDVAPSNARFLENHAAAALAAGRPDLALARYRAALSDPRSGGAVWAAYGRVLGLSRRPSEAASAFEKALALGDRSSATYAGYATSLSQSGRKERSREVLAEALRVYPEDPDLRALERSLG